MPESCNSRSLLRRRPGLAAALLAHRRAAPLLMTTAALAILPAPVAAQFKWIDADGTVTYGDRPPPGARPLGQAAEVSATPAAGGAGKAAALPYELRTAARNHPVILFLAPDCPPCEQAREHLTQRGIPHQARLVRTPQDAEAFRTLGFANLSFPALSVGSERLIGYEAGGWNRALDSAGYPTDSKLPRNWKFAQPEPLVAPEPAAVSLQAAAGADQASGTGAAAPGPAAPLPARARSTPRRADASAAAGGEPSIRF